MQNRKHDLFDSHVNATNALICKNKNKKLDWHKKTAEIISCRVRNEKRSNQEASINEKNICGSQWMYIHDFKTKTRKKCMDFILGVLSDLLTQSFF